MTNTAIRRGIYVWLLFVLVLVFGPSLLAQATGAVTPPDVPPATTNEWGGALVWSFFASTGMEWLKRHPSLSLISESTARGMQRLMGVLLAAAAALGVHYTYDATAGRLIIDGLTIAGLWTVATETVRSFVLQELVYRTAVKNYGKD